MPDISVICVNDGTSAVFSSVDRAKENGWLVYPEKEQSAEMIARGTRRGMCPACEQDAYESGAYI